MLTANIVTFPPADLLSLKLLCIQELLIVRNIPLSLSSDTIMKFLEFYGPIKEFHMFSGQEKNRNEAMVLFLHPTDAKKVIEARIQSIGGFYVEKVHHKTHAYLVDSCKSVHDQSKKSGLVDEGEDFEDIDVDNAKDFEFSFQSQELGKQLISAYSHVLANGYLTIQRLGEQSGITALVLAIFTWFSVAKIVSALFIFFKVQDRLLSLKRKGLEIKDVLVKKPAIKPLVDQADLAHQTILDILALTNKIIVSKFNNLRKPSKRLLKIKLETLEI